MTKTEIIAKIEDLYGQLRYNEYSNWENRTTMTAWNDSSERSRCSELYDEQNDLINAIEKL